MGNSTRTLQSIVDSTRTIGDLNPVLTDAGGFANEPALTIANATMGDLLQERFNWKWNRLRVPRFPLITGQQDYATVGLRGIGWLETAQRIDINSTDFPKQTWPVQVVKDLPLSSQQAGWPASVSWMLNGQLEYESWPGPSTAYTNPVGAMSAALTTPPTSIEDANGNILVLTQWGVTGTVEPLAEVEAAPGLTLTDGTVQWTVADPGAVGFRVWPRPSSGAPTWLLAIFAQMSAPLFSSLQQTIDPVPDDYSKWFMDGFIAYAHRHSANPAVQRRFEQMRSDWRQSMMLAAQQGDREATAYGFVPERTVVDSRFGYGPTGANPTNARRL